MSLARCGCPLLLLLALAVPGQQQPLTLETVLQHGTNLAVEVPRLCWHAAGHGASLVLRNADGGQDLVGLDDTWQPTAAELTGADLAVALRQRNRGPELFPPFAFVDAGRLRLPLANRIVALDRAGMRTTTVLEWPDDATAHLVAPGDHRVAWIADHELWVAERDGTRKQLSHDGSLDIVYGGAAHRAEFGITTGLFWSPDGRWLAFSREDLRPIAPYPYQDLDSDPPAPAAGRYPMAGRPHSKVTIGVYDSAAGDLAWLDNDPAEDVYWTNIAVRADGKVFAVRVDRGQDRLELVRYDARTGAREAVLLREHDREWVEPERPPALLSDGRLLWWSSRSGYRHLWLCDGDGAVQHAVTQGPFDVQALLAHDDEQVWFQAAGDDPRQLHLFRAAIDGSGTVQLTRGRGRHEATLSPDRLVASVVHSSLVEPPHAYVLDLANGATHDLPPAHDPQLGLLLPEQRFFTVTAEDGTALYGHVAIPAGAAPDARLPVLLYVYGGPHAQLVTDAWLGGAPLWQQALAAEGFVLCRLDNRGTPNRGIGFEQAVFRRLGTLEVQDQLAAIRWLGTQPFADAGRVGVHGWSFGGYLTLRLLLQAPESFACGISGAPVTDWTLYETGYTERYMDLPKENPDGYAEASCLPLAERLRRPLLLVHGTDDKTVLWAHTLRFVDACIDAGTELTYFPYPMQQHGLRGNDRQHFLRMLRRFLRQHLGASSG
jgi:dipeptidyl aminopeptidase/acylaminoacyl peptidase